MSDFDGPEMHETWQRCAGDCGHDRLLEELSTRGLCPECERPRVTYRRLTSGKLHEALTVWVNGACAGVLTVRADATSSEPVLLDWIVGALDAHGGTENR